MRLLITGGSGFIGSQLALHARARGTDVVVTGLSNNRAEALRVAELKAAGVNVIEGALQDAGFVTSVVAGCDAVIHLAAAQHEAHAPDSIFHEVNVEGVRTLLEASVAAGVKRFVYGSTIGVYGGVTRQEIDERTQTRPDNIYARTKLAAECIVQSYAARLGVTIVRISETYGPGDLRLLKLFKAIDRGVFMMIGAGLNLHQPIHVHDLVGGLMLAAERPAAVGETFILAGPEPITTRAMVEQIACALERSSGEFTIPLWPLHAAAVVLESICRPLRVSAPLHRRRLDFFRTSYSFSIRKAEAILGFTPAIPFSAGARDTAAWYRNHGLLKAPPGAVAEQARAATMGTPSPAADVPLAAFAGAHYLQHEHVLEYTHDAIIMWEMDGAGVLFWNRAAEHLYGYDRKEALGRVTHVLLKTQLEGGVDQLEEKLTRYGVWAGVLRHQRSDGSPVIVEARLALMSQRNGKWLVLEINKDVTAQHMSARASQTS